MEITSQTIKEANPGARIVEKISIQPPGVPDYLVSPEAEETPAHGAATQIKVTEKVRPPAPAAEVKPDDKPTEGSAAEVGPEGNTETPAVEAKPKGEGEVAPRPDDKPQTADAKK